MTIINTNITDTTKQPTGDYATNTALTQGLATKQPTGDYATNTALSNGLATKQDTLTAGTNITISGTTISATGGGSQPLQGTITFNSGGMLKVCNVVLGSRQSGSPTTYLNKKDKSYNPSIYSTNTITIGSGTFYTYTTNSSSSTYSYTLKKCDINNIYFTYNLTGDGCIRLGGTLCFSNTTFTHMNGHVNLLFRNGTLYDITTDVVGKLKSEASSATLMFNSEVTIEVL